MKAFKKIFAALAALILCFSLGASAWAAEPDKYGFEGKSWDEIMDEVLARNSSSRDEVAVAYVNLVTGEEYFINPDEYMVAASMYKLPLNMYFTDIITSGEFDWNANYPNLSYEEVRDASIIYSDNDQSMFLWGILGGYDAFRSLTADYMGMQEGELSPEQSFNNMYTARQFAECLKLLYNEQERFPGIIETMQKAEPERFFKLQEPRFKIAHKYGYYSENGRSNMNDCGIAFTTEPIALVMFTQGAYDPEPLLTDFCTTMCEYTEYLANKPEPTPEPSPTPEPEPLVEEAPAAAEEKGFPFVACAAAALFLLLGLVLVIRLCAKYRLRFFWLLLALLVSTGAMLLCILGARMGTVYAKPNGDPAEIAQDFMDSVCSGNYDSAYALLRDYSDLGLENVPQTKPGQLAYEALHSSFSYELTGECSIDMLDAEQPLSFTFLDLSSLESAIVEETPKQLKLIVESRPMNEIYDANRNYLPQVTEEAYVNAVAAVLENAENYYRSVELKLSLSYSDSRWQVLVSPALLKALNGGTGY